MTSTTPQTTQTVCEKGASPQGSIMPVYKTTEVLTRYFLNSKGIAKVQKEIISLVRQNIANDNNAKPLIVENLPPYIIQQESLMDRQEAFLQIHYPESLQHAQAAKKRLKFEELFYLQIRINKGVKNHNKEIQKGFVMQDKTLLEHFLASEIDFELTNAQKKVIKEICHNMASEKHMNRLLQGDVGSGKTVIALMAILVAISNKYQAAMMAPTEILAEQHYNTLKPILDNLNIKSAILTGSTKTRRRKDILEELAMGYIKVLFGTHSLIEDTVVFKNLGLAIIDEQHRFGVAQRSKLWKKNTLPPHILVMTATPIPRTLAMTAYGNLDTSILDEMPQGRMPIKTAWLKDNSRLKVFSFIREQLAKGKQTYIVYPLIEESRSLDYKYLEDGYESVRRAFPQVPVGVLHGRMRPEDKDYEMDLFVRGKTKIMVATTVIEVGINVPNATVMVIESAERFGLSQLHQLRGRVGRGKDQSYCILISGYKLTKDSKERLSTMVHTTDGFEIADADLKLRGPGNILGTQQSGLLALKIADLTKDELTVAKTRALAKKILHEDPNLTQEKNSAIKNYINKLTEQGIDMTGIS